MRRRMLWLALLASLLVPRLALAQATQTIGMVAGGTANWTFPNTPSAFLEVAGTWTGTNTFQCVPTVGAAFTVTVLNQGTGATATTTTANANFLVPSWGCPTFRVTGTAGGTGTVSLTFRAGAGAVVWNVNTAAAVGGATEAKQDDIIALLAGGLPAALGQAAMAASLPVVLASDQTGIPVTSLPANATVDLNRISGAALSATAYVPVRFTDGAAFVAPNSQLQQNTAFTVGNATGGALFGFGFSAAPAAITTSRPVVPFFDLFGRAVGKPFSVAEEDLAGLITTAMTGTTSTAVTGMGAQGGSYRVYVTQCTVSNAHATVGTDLILQDGSGGTTLYTLPAAAVYGGSTVYFPNPIKTTANTALFAANVTTGASTKLSCVGYKGI